MTTQEQHQVIIEAERAAEQLVGNFDPEAPAKLHAFAPAQAPLTRPDEIPDDEADVLKIARYILSPQAGEASSNLSELELPVRRYLSKFNLADTTWIQNPLTQDLPADRKYWAPHEFELRHEALQRDYPKPYEREQSRRGLALEHITEALQELREYVTDNDLGNGRLVQAVATAYRDEIRRLVDYLDRGAPAASGEDDEDMPRLMRKDAAVIAQATELQCWRGRKAHRRALLVPDMLRFMDFEVMVGDLGFDCPFVVDTKRRVVTVATGLDHSERTFAEARAVALIRMCLYDLNHNPDMAQLQRQMSDYVFELLLPEAELRAAVTELAHTTPPSRMARVIAREFFVPKRVAKARLDALGLASERSKAA